ncbi:hypothetical protein C8R46DRAFT_1034709 [Mycena filopes]|nr:hypothetical protein C8R46DRAFT_1034709 [Mycena filopes]
MNPQIAFDSMRESNPEVPGSTTDVHAAYLHGPKRPSPPRMPRRSAKKPRPGDGDQWRRLQSSNRPQRRRSLEKMVNFVAIKLNMVRWNQKFAILVVEVQDVKNGGGTHSPLSSSNSGHDGMGPIASSGSNKPNYKAGRQAGIRGNKSSLTTRRRGVELRIPAVAQLTLSPSGFRRRTAEMQSTSLAGTRPASLQLIEGEEWGPGKKGQVKNISCHRSTLNRRAGGRVPHPSYGSTGQGTAVASPCAFNQQASWLASLGGVGWGGMLEMEMRMRVKRKLASGSTCNQSKSNQSWRTIAIGAR